MGKFFNVQRMLYLAKFEYRLFSGIDATLFICNRCLPIVVSQGIEFQEQCGENLLSGHVYVDNDLQAGHTFTPNASLHKCANCDRLNAGCWKLRIELETLEYVDDRELTCKQLEWGDNVQVVMLGKRGRIVKQTGYDLSRPWIADYTIKFEDGMRIDAKPWQFQIVKDQS